MKIFEWCVILIDFEHEKIHKILPISHDVHSLEVLDKQSRTPFCRVGIEVVYVIYWNISLCKIINLTSLS